MPLSFPCLRQTGDPLTGPESAVTVRPDPATPSRQEHPGRLQFPSYVSNPPRRHSDRQTYAAPPPATWLLPSAAWPRPWGPGSGRLGLAEQKVPEEGGGGQGLFGRALRPSAAGL